MISVANVTLSSNETLKWIFSGLNVNVSQSNLDSIRIIIQSDSQSNGVEYLVENPKIAIYNSSFQSLDLNPQTEAQITDCYIDAQFKPRPTLITANNSDVSIQNCHFANFINENDSTVLYVYYYSHATIEKSVFIQHNSSKGILVLQNNCSLSFTNSAISKNVASSFGYSAITLRDGVHANIYGSVLENNLALMGGAMNAQDQCHVILINCTFSKNKAVTGGSGGAIFLAKQVKLILLSCTFDENSAEQFGGAVRAFTDVQIEIKYNNFTRNEALTSGGAIAVAKQVQLVTANCLFEDNTALSHGGAISCWNNTNANIQNTTFIGNNASKEGGAIKTAIQSYLNTIHCIFEDNCAQKWGGAIYGASATIMEISWSRFSGNKADHYGGAMLVFIRCELHLNNCIFEDNFAKYFGGAVSLKYNVTAEIHESTFTSNQATLGGGAIAAVFALNITINLTYFSGNNALGTHGGGGIAVGQHSQLLLTSCAFKDNFIKGSGGAISAAYYSILSIINTNFTHNKASISGGALDALMSEIRITRCFFNENRADVHGGSLYIVSKSSLTIELTKFMNNNGIEGGAIYVHETELKIEMYTFEENYARHKGGAVQVDDDSSIMMNNCRYLSNKAAHGAAMHLTNPSYSFVSGAIFFKNYASEAGGAVKVDRAKTGTDFMKCIIFEDITCTSNQAIYGGCLVIKSAILIMKSGNIIHNHARGIGSGIVTQDSRLQVGT